jgi:hypothetical protein
LWKRAPKRSLNPNGEGLPEWPVYNIQKEEILDIQSDGKFVGKPDPRKARLDVIEKAGTLRNHIQSRGGIQPVRLNDEGLEATHGRKS